MKTSAQGIALIKRFEGFSVQAYRCPAGKMTIGYGHVLQPGENFDVISAQRAEELLLADVIPVEKAIRRYVTVELAQNQFDALVCFIYNIGARAFSRSLMVRLLNNNDYNGASKQFSRWVYANGLKLTGLVQRREAEKTLFLKN